MFDESQTKAYLEESMRSKLGLVIVTGFDFCFSTTAVAAGAFSSTPDTLKLGTNSGTNGFKLAGGETLLEGMGNGECIGHLVGLLLHLTR